MTTFPKYKSNVKYNNASSTESITFGDQQKFLIPPRSAPLKKRFQNTTHFEITNKFSPLENILTHTEHTIRNLHDNSIQDNLLVIKKLSQITKNFHDLIIFYISKKQLLPSVKPVLQKDLGFCLETAGCNKLKLIDGLLWFSTSLQPREFFDKDTRKDTNSKNTVYNKTQRQ